MERPPIIKIKLELHRGDGSIEALTTANLLALKPSDISLADPRAPQQPHMVPVAVTQVVDATVGILESAIEEIKSQG